MDWQFLLALLLTVPVVLVPAVFLWYLNVSGLYRAIKGTRQRQKMKAQVLREGEEIIKRQSQLDRAAKEEALAR